MPRDVTAQARLVQNQRGLESAATSVRSASRIGVPAPFPTRGLRLAEVAAVQTSGPGSIQRYQLSIIGGHAKAATGHTVNNALVVDDTATALAVGAKVLVWLPQDGGPALIVSGASGGSGGDGEWHSFGRYAWLNQSGI